MGDSNNNTESSPNLQGDTVATNEANPSPPEEAKTGTADSPPKDDIPLGPLSVTPVDPENTERKEKPGTSKESEEEKKTTPPEENKNVEDAKPRETTSTADDSSKPKDPTPIDESTKINLEAPSNPDHDEPEDDEESSPLLPRSGSNRRILDRVWLVLFMAVVVVGISVGAFLLIWLGKFGHDISHFKLVNRQDWTSFEPLSPLKKLNVPVRNVSLIEIDASDTKLCGDTFYYEKCVKRLQKQQITDLKQPDILYNFIVDQDGTIYEGRGWDNCTCNEDFTNEDLTIGVLVNDGDIMKLVPLYVQNFLNHAITKNKLDPCYKLSLHNATAIYLISTYLKIHRNLC